MYEEDDDLTVEERYGILMLCVFYVVLICGIYKLGIKSGGGGIKWKYDSYK